MLISTRDTQFLKVLESIRVTEGGRWICESAAHPSKTPWEIFSTELGICTVVSAVHIWNAQNSILVTLSGMQTLTTDEQYSNAPVPIDFTQSGIATSVSFPVYFINTSSSIIKSLIQLIHRLSSNELWIYYTTPGAANQHEEVSCRG